MAIKDIVNKGVCEGALVGFNTNKGCGLDLKDIKEIWRTPVDFEFDGSVDLDEDYIKSLQLSGDLTIIKDIVDFPEEGTDVLTESAADSSTFKAGDAKYMFSPVWFQDPWLQAKLGALEGQYNNRFLFVDSAGNIFATEGSTDGGFKGFRTSSTYRERQQFSNGSTVKKQTLKFQIADTYEVDDYPVTISVDSLDFNPRQIEAVVQAYISYTANPADTDTSISFTVVLDRGRKDYVTGLTTSGDFKFVINGTTEAAAVASETDNVYTLSTTALATNDNTSLSINGRKEVTGDAIYVSNVVKKVVV